MSNYSLCQQGNDFSYYQTLEAADEDQSKSEWKDVEDLHVDHGFEDRILAALDGEVDPDIDEPKQYDSLDDWRRDNDMTDEGEHHPTEAVPHRQLLVDYKREDEELIEELLEGSDEYVNQQGQVGQNRTNIRKWHWSTDEMKHLRSGGRQKAKFQIRGKRGHKDLRDQRVGNRQCFADRRDYWAEYQDLLEELHHEWNPPAIPEFGIYVVGLTDEEASRYEAEFERDRDDYIRELEMSWYEPEVDVQYRPYRFSSWDYEYYDPYDDYGMSHEDDLRCDEPDFEDKDFGPTLEEWVELDRIALERMMEEEADRFSPSFVGSQRSNLRYHILEPRRGKRMRKYGNSSSFLYRNGRPYTAVVVHH